MTSSSDTLPQRPIPPRPKYGWQAWEATTGYIANQYSPDAMLKIEIYPMTGVVGWAASFTWGQEGEEVRDCLSFAEALSKLWHHVEGNHPMLLQTFEALTKRPTNYGENDWLDEHTFEVFSRLVGVIETAFRGDWQLMIVYQPVEQPEARVQARLLAQRGEVSLGGRGATLRDACRMLFRTAAVKYRAFVLKSDE